MKAYTIFEILEYGPIVACDKNLGIIVTASKTTLNAWTMIGPDKYIGNTKCKPITTPTGLNALEKLKRHAHEWIDELIVNDDLSF
jgi:hypothetical protein